MPSNQFPSPPPTLLDDLPSTSNSDTSGVLAPPDDVRPIPPNYVPPTPAAAPIIKASPFRYLIPAIAVITIILIVIFIGSKAFGPKSSIKSAGKEPVTITYWGLWETPSIMKPVLDAFQADNPDIKVNYQMQSHTDYQARVITAISSQKAPDVVRIHSTWLPVVYQSLLPAPSNTISEPELKTNFYPATSILVINKQVYGIPITMESLALYVNTKMLESSSLSIPKTWEDLQSAAKTLTVRDQATGKITRAGIALGNTINVDSWPDIVSLMLLQGGGNLLSPTPKSFESTLKYYVSFGKGPDAVWDANLPTSTLAFANEKVAMIIATSWKALDIQSINPNLSWKVAPVPQLPEVDPVNWTSYWLESVPKNSPHPQEAWRFVTFLGSAKAQQLLFESASRERGYSQAPAHKSIAPMAQQNPIMAPFVESLPTAKTFYTASMTHDSDTALNSRLIKYLEDAVNNLINTSSQDPQYMNTLINGFNQVLSQYRLVTPIPVPVN